jgi:hypothetical protein
VRWGENEKVRLAPRVRGALSHFHIRQSTLPLMADASWGRVPNSVRVMKQRFVFVFMQRCWADRW